MKLKEFVRYLGTIGYSRTDRRDITHELIMFDNVVIAQGKFVLERDIVVKQETYKAPVKLSVIK